MKFLCPDCGCEEQIVGDLNPRCRFCRVEMVPPSDYSEWWMSPHFAIERMQKISETYGTEKARRAGRFKKEREAWTTAMLAMGLTKLTDKEWWIEITAENTPDTRLRRIEQEPGGNIIETFEIEIVDWEQHIDNVMEVIKKKCARAYPPKYILLINARNAGKAIDFDGVVEELKTMTPLPFLEVWIVVFVGPGNIKVVRVAPALPFVDLTRADFERASKQKTFLRQGTRSTSSEMKDLGLVYMPIPTLR